MSWMKQHPCSCCEETACAVPCPGKDPECHIFQEYERTTIKKILPITREEFFKAVERLDQ